MRPDVEERVVTFTFGDGTDGKVLLDAVSAFLLRVDDFLLLRRDAKIGDRERQTGKGRVLEAKFLHVVEQIDRRRTTEEFIRIGDHAAAALGGECRVIERHALGKNVVENQTTDGGRDDSVLWGFFFSLAVIGDNVRPIDADANHRVHANLLAVIGVQHFMDVVKCEFLAGGTIAGFALVTDSEIVNSEHDILRRPDDRRTRGGREDVVRRQHQDVRFRLRFDRERQVDGHLIAVEICVEALTNQRVNLDRVAFDEHRLERLNAHSVKGRGAIEEHRVALDDFFKDIPDFLVTAFDHFLRGLDRVGEAVLFELADDERLIQFERDLLGQTALVNLEFRADDDDGAGGVINALTEEILAESPLLALDHVGQRLEGTIRGTQHRTAATTVVKESIDRLLQHALFVADDDFRCVQIDQLLQPVVAVDDAAIQVIQIRRGKVAGLEEDERTKIGRDHGDHVVDHPLGLVFRVADRFDDLEALGVVLDLLLGVGLENALANHRGFVGEIHLREQRANRLRAHVGLEAIAEFLLGVAILFFRQELLTLERGRADVNDHVILIVDDFFKIAGLHVQKVAQAAGHGLEEPDVDDRRGEIDVAHALAAHAAVSHLDSAAVADDALVFCALVLAAGAFPVAFRPEDTFAEQAVAFRTVGAIVDRLRLFDFAKGPRTNVVRGGEGNLDGAVVIDAVVNRFSHLSIAFQFRPGGKGPPVNAFSDARSADKFCRRLSDGLPMKLFKSNDLILPDVDHPLCSRDDVNNFRRGNDHHLRIVDHVFVADGGDNFERGERIFSFELPDALFKSAFFAFHTLLLRSPSSSPM